MRVARGVGRQLQGVQRHARVAVGALDEMFERVVLYFEVTITEATLGVGQGAAHDRLNVGVAQRPQREHAHAREQRGIDFETWILGGGADQRHRAVFGMRQDGVLLSLVPTVDFVDKQDRALVGGAPRLIDDSAQVGHARAHGRQGHEAGVGQSSDDLRKGSFA